MLFFWKDMNILRCFELWYGVLNFEVVTLDKEFRCSPQKRGARPSPSPPGNEVIHLPTDFGKVPKIWKSTQKCRLAGCLVGDMRCFPRSPRRVAGNHSTNQTKVWSFLTDKQQPLRCDEAPWQSVSATLKEVTVGWMVGASWGGAGFSPRNKQHSAF